MRAIWAGAGEDYMGRCRSEVYRQVQIWGIWVGAG